jgi:ubiquinone/menaquinone biosynthesis C-methylase UbiE
MAAEDLTYFTTVDQPADPGFFLRFLDEANNLPDIISWKPMILDGLHLSLGAHVLDMGCGVGTDAFAVAQSVGPGGHVTGVDISETLIAEACRRAANLQLPTSFEVGDVHALRFADGTFDAVRSERMLLHVPNPIHAMEELFRVLRSGGHMAMADLDWEMHFCNSDYKDLTRKIVMSFSDGMKNAWLGRRLPQLFKEAGFRDVSLSFHVIAFPYAFVRLLLGGHVAHMVASGALSGRDADLWWTQLGRADAQGVYCHGVTGVVISGSKP